MKTASVPVQREPRAPVMNRLTLVVALALAAAWSAPAAAQENAVSASERLAMPGEEHAWLEPLVGEWTVEMLVYPGPGAEPFPQPPLTATREWLLDGRYLREQLRNGETVLREGTLGFNRLDGRFELVTVDAYEPGQMVYQGRGDETPARMSLYGESTEAGMGAEPTGRRRDLRFEVEIAGPDRNVERIFVTYPGEEEFLFVEQRFTRAD